MGEVYLQIKSYNRAGFFLSRVIVPVSLVEEVLETKNSIWVQTKRGTITKDREDDPTGFEALKRDLDNVFGGVV
jgi:hypothetical protein